MRVFSFFPPSCVTVYVSTYVYVFCYVGRTHVYYDTRKSEHFERDTLSGVFKHFKSKPDCKAKNKFESFSILDNARTDYELALKEAMHIKWENPDLNGQKKHEIIRLFI